MRDARRKVKKARSFRVSVSLSLSLSLSFSLSFRAIPLCSRVSDFPAFTILHGFYVSHRTPGRLCVTKNLQGMKGEDF